MLVTSIMHVLKFVYNGIHSTIILYYYTTSNIKIYSLLTGAHEEMSVLLCIWHCGFTSNYVNLYRHNYSVSCNLFHCLQYIICTNLFKFSLDLHTEFVLLQFCIIYCLQESLQHVSRISMSDCYNSKKAGQDYNHLHIENIPS